MKFTIAVSDLASLLKAAVPRPRTADTFTLSACAARVFVECKGEVAGIEALVFADGAVTLPARSFRELLKTYKGKRFLTFEADSDGLRIQTFRMKVLRYDPHPHPPAYFPVFPVSSLPGSTTTQNDSNRIQ
jgi:hypothetical protein